MPGSRSSYYYFEGARGVGGIIAAASQHPFYLEIAWAPNHLTAPQASLFNGYIINRRYIEL